MSNGSHEIMVLGLSTLGFGWLHYIHYSRHRTVSFPDLKMRRLETGNKCTSSEHVAAEEVGHCMLPYIRDQILELVNESLLVGVFLCPTSSDVTVYSALTSWCGRHSETACRISSPS